MGAQAIALFVAGILSPFLAQIVINLFGDPNGPKALYLYFGVSVLIAALALVFTGGLPAFNLADPVAFFTTLGTALGEVFTLGTLVYHTFKPTVAGVKIGK